MRSIAKMRSQLIRSLLRTYYSHSYCTQELEKSIYVDIYLVRIILSTPRCFDCRKGSLYLMLIQEKKANRKTEDVLWFERRTGFSCHLNCWIAIYNADQNCPVIAHPVIMKGPLLLWTMMAVCAVEKTDVANFPLLEFDDVDEMRCLCATHDET